MQFRIKICGVTREEDVVAAVDAGADAIGLNFYEKSPRFVDIEQARRILWNLDSQITVRAGVFVNLSPLQIQSIVTQVGLTAIQLHGDEPPRLFAEIARTTRPPDFQFHAPLIRARRMCDKGVAEIAADLAECTALGVRPAAVLVDAATPSRYGGTGTTVSWSGLVDHRNWLGATPLVLAGGLTPDNVAEAIRIVRPQAVDVASGVESSPGKKDKAKVRDFVAAAREAFEQF